MSAVEAIKAKVADEIRRHRKLQEEAKAEAAAFPFDSAEYQGARAVMRLHEGAVMALESLDTWLDLRY